MADKKFLCKTRPEKNIVRDKTKQDKTWQGINNVNYTQDVKTWIVWDGLWVKLTYDGNYAQDVKTSIVWDGFWVRLTYQSK